MLSWPRQKSLKNEFLIEKTVFFVVNEENKEKMEKQKAYQKNMFFLRKNDFFNSWIDQSDHQHQHASNDACVFVRKAFPELKMQISVNRSGDKSHLEKNQQVT